MATLDQATRAIASELALLIVIGVIAQIRWQCQLVPSQLSKINIYSNQMYTVLYHHMQFICNWKVFPNLIDLNLIDSIQIMCWDIQLSSRFDLFSEMPKFLFSPNFDGAHVNYQRLLFSHTDQITFWCFFSNLAQPQKKWKMTKIICMIFFLGARTVLVQ